ncbi:MAG: succinylglutamate desuccinylase/aspartoacylase family protein [Phycisphaeraceae bacterium]
MPPSPSPSSRSRTTASDVHIGGIVIRPGQRRRLELPVARLPTQTQMALPVEVVNGTRPGPRLWLSAALHGDELNGVEIIHRVMQKLEHASLVGEVIAAPIVNVFGFIQQDRYLPDRRDLNRCFPGIKNGSLASRLANLFMTEIVGRCTHGIDLHTASNHRSNLPQVRANLNDPETRRVAAAFAAPVMMQGDAPRGSLRDAVARRKIPIICYEAGEPMRLNADAIKLGVAGVMRVMVELGMLRSRSTKPRPTSTEIGDRTWVRAVRSGILRLRVKAGQHVHRDQSLGAIHDAFGDEQVDLLSPDDGLIIGHTNNPLVNQGDAIIHLART